MLHYGDGIEEHAVVRKSRTRLVFHFVLQKADRGGFRLATNLLNCHVSVHGANTYSRTRSDGGMFGDCLVPPPLAALVRNYPTT